MIIWSVVHTQINKETIAAQNLLLQGFEVYYPRFKKIRRHARKVDEVLVPLFPRYIFVGINFDDIPWHKINNTRGVSYLLMNNDKRPAQVPTEVIECFKSQEVEEGILPPQNLNAFSKGSKVRILEGAFKDQVAIFESLDNKKRVQLLLEFLGRESRISIPEYALEAA